MSNVYTGPTFTKEEASAIKEGDARAAELSIFIIQRFQDYTEIIGDSERVAKSNFFKVQSLTPEIKKNSARVEMEVYKLRISRPNDHLGMYWTEEYVPVDFVFSTEDLATKYREAQELLTKIAPFKRFR
jgi:hypothetical protein